jgi:hypothetical protein
MRNKWEVSNSICYESINLIVNQASLQHMETKLTNVCLSTCVSFSPLSTGTCNFVGLQCNPFTTLTHNCSDRDINDEEMDGVDDEKVGGWRKRDNEEKKKEI